MYRHSAILPVWKHAGRIVRGLFDFFMREPGAMALRMGGGGVRRGRAGAGAAGRRLYRRHDRPLCAGAGREMAGAGSRSRARIDRAVEMRQNAGAAPRPLSTSKGRKMSEPLRLGIAGLGTVGAAVVRLLTAQARDLAARTGRDIVVTGVSARDSVRERGRRSLRRQMVRRSRRIWRARKISTCSSN